MFLINITSNITLESALLALIISSVIGAIYAIFYAFNRRNDGYDKSFIMSLVILPAIVSIIIMLVSNDIVKAFSLGGVFTLIRFRTRVKDIKDAAFLFVLVGIGFSCGLEYWAFAIIIAIFFLIVLTILHLLKLDCTTPNVYRLKILIPESLDYVNVFNETFAKYLSKCTLKKVKTTDFGSLIELTYLIRIIDETKQKDFIDDLRKKNGNLNIILADDYEKLMNATK